MNPKQFAALDVWCGGAAAGTENHITQAASDGAPRQTSPERRG